MTIERVPDCGTNGTRAYERARPEASTRKSSHTSVRRLISGVGSPARTSVL